MKIILLGANGMLGSMVHYVGIGKVIPLSRTEFDALKTPVTDLDKYFADTDADTDRVIINCIGAIPQKKPCDELYFQLNRDFPNQLAAYCKDRSIHLIHISTNCVFSGKAPLMKETDTPDAEDAYGMSKAQGEPNTAIVLRCSIIGFEKYGHGPGLGLLEWFLSQTTAVNGYTDHYWNGLTTYELAHTIFDLIEKKQFRPRIEHHYSSNILSKYEILTVVSKLAAKETPITPIAHGERHYTLGSIFAHTAHKPIEAQLEELFEIQDSYRTASILASNTIALNPVTYQEMKPYPHGYVDSLLNSSFATDLLFEIQHIPSDAWDRYENPFEQKFTLRDKYSFPPKLHTLFDLLQSAFFIKQIETITGHSLVLDTTRNFWGVHKYLTGDKLDIHVDAGFHPTLGLKKQVTLGIYLSRDWDETKGCALEIWNGSNAGDDNPHITDCATHILPLFNRLVLFDCNDVAWHGNPEPCLADGRIFITISYLSHETEYKNTRVKALFVKRPCDPEDPEKDMLRLMRADPEKYKLMYNTHLRK